MYSTKEYIETMTVSLDDLRKMMKAQYDMWDKGFNEKNYSALTAALQACSTILSFAFLAPTPVAVASAIAGLVSSLDTNFITTEQVVKNGLWDLQGLVSWMTDNPKYDLIKVKIGFLEFTGDYNIRFVQHTSTNYITAVHTSGGWVLAN